MIAGEPLRIGLPAIDGFAPLVRQLLPGAQFLRFPTIDKLVAALGKEEGDAAVTSAAMLAYGMPAGEFALQQTIDSWIEIKRGHVAFERAYSHWIRGEGLYPRHPRWSIARNVLGWGLK